jgi:hypothetical protein
VRERERELGEGERRELRHLYSERERESRGERENGRRV